MTSETGSSPSSKRSRRHVKSVARLLQKEARRILKKHEGRIGNESSEAIRAAIASIDTARKNDDASRLETDAEALDELLQKHADFARKSAFRETAENVGFAVSVALMLRVACYEPFKIPSGSMIPTLVVGDQIFVNKYASGVQVPFTNHVVAEDWMRNFERGDVIVFRYPINEELDYIKRIVGLPGDIVRVRDGKISIRDAGTSVFREVKQTPTGDPCVDRSGLRISNCQLYEESQGPNTYTVRYISDRHLNTPEREYQVPTDHFFVMGDNRNESQDSRAWQKSGMAVSATHLLKVRDLRDVTPVSLWREGSDANPYLNDLNTDQVVYVGTVRAADRDIKLQLWRNPGLGAQAVFDAVSRHIAGGETLTMEQLLARGPEISADEHGRIIEAGAGIDAMTVARTDQRMTATFMLGPDKTVFRIDCGARACSGWSSLGRRVADIVSKFQAGPKEPIIDYVNRDPSMNYDKRAQTKRPDNYVDIEFHQGSEGVARERVRARVWQKPGAGTAIVRTAALGSVGATPDSATPVTALGDDSWRVDTVDSYVFVLADGVRDIVALIECGKSVCSSAAVAAELSKKISDRMPAADANPRKLQDILLAKDTDATKRKIGVPQRDESWQQINLLARVSGPQSEVRATIFRQPKDGLNARVAKLRNEAGNAVDAPTLPGGWKSEQSDSWTYGFAVPQADVVIRLECAKEVCDETDGQKLAQRLAEKAKSNNFVAEGLHAAPFVPRGHVKGKAERVWWTSGPGEVLGWPAWRTVR